MSGFETAVGVAGIAGFGIQVCQGLMSFYHDFKNYDSDISDAYRSVTDLNTVLGLLKVALEAGNLEANRADCAGQCLRSCEDGLHKLSETLRKLRKYRSAQEVRNKIRAKSQRALYPFQAETLAKLQASVQAVHERLALAIQTLQLDTLTTIDAAVSNLSTQQRYLLEFQKNEKLRGVVDWLAAPDPWTNHTSARKLHEERTGEWLLQSDQYGKWKNGITRHFWIYGKAGCGKTVLCSTIVEDIRSFCQSATNSVCAPFYFSFSDERKQTYDDFLRSLVAQLAWKDPALSRLFQAYDRPNRPAIHADELEAILRISIGSFKTVFVLLDALDECPERNDIRSTLMDCLRSLANSAESLKIFATSRDESDIHESLSLMQVEKMSIDTVAVNADIKQYVCQEIRRERRLARLSQKSKQEVENALVNRADGIFRWVYCQLQELKRLKDLRPSYIRKALENLPPTLDATYMRMLRSIDEIYYTDALVLLKWLAYAREPPILLQLADTVVIDSPSGIIDFDDRGDLDGSLNILSGLVTVVQAGSSSQSKGYASVPNGQESTSENDPSNAAWVSDDEDPGRARGITGRAKVRLAHFSVKEFLESTRISAGDTRNFRLNPNSGHSLVAMNCLQYIMSYSESQVKTIPREDFYNWPLLGYAASNWHYHTALANVERVVDTASDLLSSELTVQDWLQIHDPESDFGIANLNRLGWAGMYYAAFFGAEKILSVLMERGHSVDSYGGLYERPLAVAASKGHVGSVRLLLDGGADIHAGDETSALAAASENGHHAVVQLLLQRGAEVNALIGKRFTAHTALIEAAKNGFDPIVQTLLDHGAEIDAIAHPSALAATALIAACGEGHARTIDILLERGANVNVVASGNDFPTALTAASKRGHVDVARVLLNRGAQVGTVDPGSLFPTALAAACEGATVTAVEILLQAGADANTLAPKSSNPTALIAACNGGNVEIVRILLDWGAKVNTIASESSNPTALSTACQWAHTSIVRLLIERGAEVNSPAGAARASALGKAIDRGSVDIVRLLLQYGADVDAKDHNQWHGDSTALEIAEKCAQANAHYHQVVQVLREHSAASDRLTRAEQHSLLYLSAGEAARSSTCVHVGEP